MRIKLLLATAVVAGVFFSSVGFAPVAQARVRCSYSGPPGNLLTVRTGASDTAYIRRDGAEIAVVFFNLTLDKERTRCSGGTPTVFNTDTIRVRGDLDVQLGGGPFAPGATPEVAGAPEIEIQFTGGVSIGTVIGTRRADEFHWGPSGANPGLNLNPRSVGDNDVDITAAGDIGLIADGAAGRDRIIPAPGAVFPDDSEGVFSQGGRGNDLLIAPRKTGGLLDGDSGNDILIGGNPGDQLSGGSGRDRIEGRGGRDRIRGGPGRDLLLGGRGNDRIHSRDQSRDRIRCGPGRDKARADRRDRVRGCEVTRRR